MVNDGKDDFNVYQFDTKEPKIDKKKINFYYTYYIRDNLHITNM